MTLHPQDTSYAPPREYQQLLRGPRFAWWRPLVVLLLVLALLLVVAILVGAGLAVAGRDLRHLSSASGEMTVAVFALTNLLLAALIPIALLSTRIAHGADAAYLSSVAGGLRWQWIWRCLRITVPLFVVCAGLALLIEWPQAPRPAQWELLLLLVLVGTPLQAAGEEYIFRGLVMQNIGACFRRPRTAMWMATAVSTVLFALVHGSTDPWILLDLGIGAVACCILVWRTGGLEAAIVLHAVNNMVGMSASLVFGGWDEDFVRETSKGNPLDPALTLLVASIVVALILRQARRQGLQHVRQPETEEATAGIAAPRRARLFTLPGTAVVSVVVAMNVWAGAAALPPREAARLPKLRYADIATRMGVTPDGCLKGNRIESLPLEIRRYAGRELVGDDVRVTLGKVVIAGRDGVFDFPLSAELMASNPDFWVVQPDGKRIDYHYKFVSTTVQSKGSCAPRTAQDPPAA